MSSFWKVHIVEKFKLHVYMISTQFEATSCTLSQHMTQIHAAAHMLNQIIRLMEYSLKNLPRIQSIYLKNMLLSVKNTLLWWMIIMEEIQILDWINPYYPYGRNLRDKSPLEVDILRREIRYQFLGCSFKLFLPKL